MNSFKKRCSYSWPLLYFLIYLPWFFWLEKNVTEYTVMHCRLDDFIPFCEYFIIPYLFWFLYIAAIIIGLLFFGTKDDFFRCCKYLFLGMTIALLICTLFPNGQEMRPILDDSPTPLTRLVTILFAVDTNTNVFPSIHTYNSIAAHLALCKSSLMLKHPRLKWASFVSMILICMSTVFLKQHSILDMFGGIALAIALYGPIFYPEAYRFAAKKKNYSTKRTIS